MYKNVEMIMLAKSLKKADVAAALGIQYQTFLYKLRGVYPFTLDEAFKIKSLLKTDISIDVLFAQVV